MSREFALKQTLGRGFTRGDVVYQGEYWGLQKGEIEDLQDITAGVAIQELAFERRNKNFKDYNRFVDGSQFKVESDVKFGGKIEYNEVSFLSDLMLYLEGQLRVTIRLSAHKTGALGRSLTWRRNGKNTDAIGVPILDVGDQLVVYADIRYAKYQEFGYRKIPGKFIFKKIVAKARAKFGRAFIIEHKLLQTSEIPGGKVQAFRSTKTGRTIAYTKFTKEYYKQRWAVSYPAIKITQRQGVGFYV